MQQRLEGAFTSCGLPDAMLMDRGAPWWNAGSVSGWTRLPVWLMKQGVRLYFSGIRHPQTQGKVERFHGALELARRRRGLPQAADYQHWLDQFRQECNHLRPHEALGMKTPASIWHKSQRPYQPNPPLWYYPTGTEVQQLEPNGQPKLEGKSWQVSGSLAGEWVQLVRIEQRVLAFYCNTAIREIDLAGQGTTAMVPWPANHNV